MSKVELAKIKALSFSKDEVTKFRRTSALPQLVCIGKPCNLYQPEVVRCENLGGSGVDIDWKCQADLPESLRFGKVTVACEGFSKPGDRYVLKGSCNLEYRLVQVHGSLLKTDDPLFKPLGYDWGEVLFWMLMIFCGLFILYKFFQAVLGNGDSNTDPRGGRPGDGGGPGGYYNSGHHRDENSRPPPPPYSKDVPPSYSDNVQREPGWQNVRPGFWTGAALGGLANHLLSRNRNVDGVDRNARNRAPSSPPPQSPYDWEARRSGAQIQAQNRESQYSDRRNRGEGSSGLGAMRSSSGFGGSSVR